MNALQELTELEYQTRYQDKTIPEYARHKKRFSDRTANQLTQSIITFLKLRGWHAERVNVTGRPIDNTKVVTNTLGQKQRIGSIDWIKGTGTKGSADIHCLINGRAVFIEVKMKDRQSEAQKCYQKTVERAGGIYWICHNFDEFMNNYNYLFNKYLKADPT